MIAPCTPPTARRMMTRLPFVLPSAALLVLLAEGAPLSAQNPTANCTGEVRAFLSARRPQAAPNLEPDERAVAGVVTDESGVPLMGVFVSIVGTDLLTRTDEKGSYILRHTERQVVSRPMVRVCQGWDYLTEIREIVFEHPEGPVELVQNGVRVPRAGYAERVDFRLRRRPSQL